MSEEAVTEQLAECKIEEGEADPVTKITEEEEKVDAEDEGKEGRRQKKKSGEEVILEQGVTGHVKWYNVWQHYGFIGRDDDPDADVFVHQSGIAKSRTLNPRFRTLDMGEEVVFDVVAGKGGELKKAVNVTGPDGKRVRGCYFFEQYIRNCASQNRRSFGGRGDARPRFVKKPRNARKITNGEEKGKKPNPEKSAENNASTKKSKPSRSSNGREKRRGERRQHADTAQEDESEKKQQTVDSSVSEPVENEVAVEA